MKNTKTPASAEEIRIKLENDLLSIKGAMYAALTFFLSGQAMVAFICAAFLFILMGLFLAILWFLGNRDPDLIKVILHYEWPKIFPAP